MESGWGVTVCGAGRRDGGGGLYGHAGGLASKALLLLERPHELTSRWHNCRHSARQLANTANPCGTPSPSQHGRQQVG